MQFVTPLNVLAALFLLIPYLAAACFPDALAARTRNLFAWLQISAPAALCIAYILVAAGAGIFHLQWFALYLILPVAIAALLSDARRVDPAQLGNWRDFLVLIALGLAVDLRWFEHAWPEHLSVFNKVLLLDAGIYGFVLIRQLDGTGFNLRLRTRDLAIGLRECALYTPIALALGLALGFLHFHSGWPAPARAALAWVFTFFFIAVPEELFFRGWMQNLLEKRIGRYGALFLTACIFGLAHFNKRTNTFNWRYVLLAAVAGIFYGRAWRDRRRIGASSITHATVDAIWGLWLR